MKRLLALTLSLLMLLGLAACGGDGSGSSPATKNPAGSGADGKTYQLTISGIGGSLNYIPVYIAEQEGWFAAAGLEVEDVMFTNGPVQMEALSSNSWDLGCTGVGGVLSGVLGYDALLVGSSNTDNGTQYVFARNESPIVAAGKGSNSVSGDIYGDAASWKGAKILCNTGTVLQYLLTKTLSGFGLTTNDVTFIAMDVPTAYSAFQAGEGDVCVLTGSAGTFPMLADTENYTAVSSGNWADTGLMCSFVANKNSYADPEKYEAMKIFMKIYFETLDWMAQNPDKATQYLVDFNDENGSSLELDTAATYLKADTYFSLQEACDMMNNKAEGQEYSVMESKILDVLKFFIESGSYETGDDQKFMGHMDAKLLNDVLAMK